ncbi:hypothetical protein SAMN05216518_13017 [Bacteroidales bacterium KHT7]|nr:hypothetical protein SAMN05216518_13017 [Bacteroidales bacterium KHT7]
MSVYKDFTFSFYFVLKKIKDNTPVMFFTSVLSLFSLICYLFITFLPPTM